VLVDFLCANADIFAWSPSDMPSIPREVAEHSLDIRAGAGPVKQPLHRFDEEKRRAIGEEIHKLMAAGFIKEVFHPEWLANLVLVRKKGGKWRMCVDYTGLNKACPKVPYPLPHIDQIVDSTAGCETMSFLDAYSGYHQIRMKESDQLATSFITPFGMYCYVTMSIGLRNAGATYQRCMNHVFGQHYVLRLHFPASNNVAEYEALVNGLRIAIELGVRCLDARGDSQLVIDQVMKNSHCRDPKMEAYCDEVRRLEDKFYGLELNHIARRYNETADELAKIASGRTTVPRTSSHETYINPRSRPTTRPSPRRPRPSPRHPRLSPRRPRLSPRHPRPPRVRHCTSRESGMGSRLIETGRPRTCNISTEESCPSTEPKHGDWRGAPSRSSCWGTGRSCTTAAP
jgi:ribonuclease HI